MKIDEKFIIPTFWIIFIIVWIYTLRRWKHLVEVCTRPVVWKISKIEENHDGSRVTYKPIYSFTVNGKEYSWPIWISSPSKTEFKVWDTHDLLYNPENPNEFIDAKRNWYKIVWIAAIVMWLIFCVAGVWW